MQNMWKSWIQNTLKLIGQNTLSLTKKAIFKGEPRGSFFGVWQPMEEANEQESEKEHLEEIQN